MDGKISNTVLSSPAVCFSFFLKKLIFKDFTDNKKACKNLTHSTTTSYTVKPV